MTSLSTKGTNPNRTGSLGVTGDGDLAVLADVLWAVGADMVSGLALVAPDCGEGRGPVWGWERGSNQPHLLVVLLLVPPQDPPPACCSRPITHPLRVRESSIEKWTKFSPRELLHSSVEPPVHQHDKDGATGCGQDSVRGLADLSRYQRESEAGKHLSDKSVVAKEGNELGEGRGLRYENR